MKLLLLFLITITGFARADDVKIDSFFYLGEKNSAAEICGTVLAPTGKAQMIKILVDPENKNPGYYYIWSGGDGKFCSVVSTIDGKAQVGLDK
jgi:hypothetical protein